MKATIYGCDMCDLKAVNQPEITQRILVICHPDGFKAHDANLLAALYLCPDCIDRLRTELANTVKRLKHNENMTDTAGEVMCAINAPKQETAK